MMRKNLSGILALLGYFSSSAVFPAQTAAADRRISKVS